MLRAWRLGVPGFNSHMNRVFIGFGVHIFSDTAPARSRLPLSSTPISVGSRSGGCNQLQKLAAPDTLDSTPLRLTVTNPERPSTPESLINLNT